MAVTSIHAIKNTLKKAIDYIKNEKKTESGLLVSGLNCAPEIADIEFTMTKTMYGKNDGNLAYHLHQSFAPGEINKDIAHEIALKLAEDICRDEYQAVVTTHVDKHHIHNHIIFNSVSFTNGKKYNDCKTTYNNIRSKSDELCQEYKLSVIENPSKKGVTYKEWSGADKEPSVRMMVCKDIDIAIEKCNSFNEVIKELQEHGYSIKQGKYLSFKPKGKERYVRDRTLGFKYSEESIKARISLKQKDTSRATIKADIDNIILKCNSFDEFVKYMNLTGYRIKRGKYISFKPEGKERYIRSKSIGVDYTEEAINSKIQMNLLGFKVESIGAGNSVKRKIYKAKFGKNSLYNKSYYYRSLLEINFLLAIAIIRELNKKSEIVKEKRTQNAYASKQSTEKLKLLSTQLSFIRTQKISSIRQVEEKMETAKSKYNETKKTLIAMEKLTDKYDVIYKAINDFKENEKYFNELNKAIFKSKVASKYEYELRVYRYSKSVLERSGIQNEKDVEDFIANYSKHRLNINLLKNSYEKLRYSISEYETLKKTIEKVRDKNFVFENGNSKKKATKNQI